jgi:hypothetical protein
MHTPDPVNDSTPSDFSVRRSVHDELLNRLRQRGIRLNDPSASDADWADLLTAVDAFDRAVEEAGGDLFVDAPDSSEPENPAFVLPHPHTDEHVSTYTRRVNEAARRIGDRTQNPR